MAETGVCDPMPSFQVAYPTLKVYNTTVLT